MNSVIHLLTLHVYILNSTSNSGSYVRWIEFHYVNQVTITCVVLHYYCSGNPPQIQVGDLAGSPDSFMPIPHHSTATQRQNISFDACYKTKHINLHVKDYGGQFYLSEVYFTAEGNIHIYISYRHLVDWNSLSYCSISFIQVSLLALVLAVNAVEQHH